MIWVHIALVDLTQELVQRVFQNMVVFPKNYICLLKLKLLNVCCFNLSSINLSFRTEKKHCLSGNLSQVLIGLAHEISIKHFLKRSSLAGSRSCRCVQKVQLMCTAKSNFFILSFSLSIFKSPQTFL